MEKDIRDISCNMKQDTDIAIAREKLEKSPELTLVVVKNREIVFTHTGRGVGGLLGILKSTPEKLRNSSVADKIIGKAAAFLLVYGNISSLFATVISSKALKLIEKYHIPVDYRQVTDFILNRNKDGMCPMEKMCQEMDNPQEVYEKLSQILKGGSFPYEKNP